MIDAVANRLGFEPERTLVNIEHGNTSSASIPLAGMTWASALVRWGAR